MLHDTPRLCVDFKFGRCRQSNDCRFSHDITTTTTSTSSTSSTTNPQPREENSTEVICPKWTCAISRPNTNSSHFETSVNTKTFFQMGWNMIESGDTGTRQHVITKLDAETGLAIIKTLTDIIDASQRDETTVSIFRDSVLPFYRIISHSDVLSLLILETPVNTIYTFPFGPNGRRGLNVFRFAITALSGMILGYRSMDKEVSTITISSSLAVLDRLIKINQSTQTVEGFTVIIESISACIPEKFRVPNAEQSLTRIRCCLNIGSSLPLVPTQSAPQNLISAAFHSSQDLPGNLFNNGVRHDNDLVGVTDILILPTAQEIAPQRQECLLLVNLTQHHLSGLAGFLDGHFRLLCKDTVGQLQDAVHEEVMRLEHLNRNVSTQYQGQQGVRKLIYHNARSSRMCVDRRKGLQVVVEFDQPTQINNKSTMQREDWWNWWR